MKILPLSKTFDFISCMEHTKKYINNASVFLVQSVGSIVVLNLIDFVSMKTVLQNIFVFVFCFSTE